MAFSLDSIDSILKSAKRAAAVSVLVGTALFAGCANADAQSEQTAQSQQTATVRPEVIYVYAFQSDADDVKLDNHGIVSKLKTSFSDDSAEQQQAQHAQQAREEVANEIVAKLQSMGLRAIRADVPPPANQNVLAVEGSIDSIDAGNRRRRTLIGLGAGKSKVGATVQLVYQPAHGTPQLLQQFDADANSGHAPGIAEMAGIGAAAGHAVTSLAVSGGVHAMTESKAGVSSDEKKLADSIVKQIAKVVGAA
jgi:ribosomal protein S19E (S16A)